jgi:uncharacterized BrkB/YihY/UPF0761 family membrane protein
VPVRCCTDRRRRAAGNRAFRLRVTYVADFKSPIGTLTTPLVLTSYVFASAAVFLAGAQLDELLRKQRSA